MLFKHCVCAAVFSRYWCRRSQCHFIFWKGSGRQQQFSNALQQHFFFMCCSAFTTNFEAIFHAVLKDEITAFLRALDSISCYIFLQPPWPHFSHQQSLAPFYWDKKCAWNEGLSHDYLPSKNHYVKDHKTFYWHYFAFYRFILNFTHWIVFRKCYQIIISKWGPNR